jgi:hypothetical protein
MTPSFQPEIVKYLAVAAAGDPTPHPGEGSDMADDQQEVNDKSMPIGATAHRSGHRLHFQRPLTDHLG